MLAELEFQLRLNRYCKFQGTTKMFPKKCNCYAKRGNHIKCSIKTSEGINKGETKNKHKKRKKYKYGRDQLNYISNH